MGVLTSPKCKHANLRGIYGDEIIHAGYRRVRCTDCGKPLKRPLNGRSGSWQDTDILLKEIEEVLNGHSGIS